MLNNRGIALFIVLGMFFIIILLGNVALGVMSNQTRLTHHSVSRIQAMYAAQAATNLAQERLRTGAWPVPSANTVAQRYLCRTAGACPGACDLVDGNLPGSLTGNGCVEISIYGLTPSGGACPYPSAGVSGGSVACIKVKSDYRYSNP